MTTLQDPAARTPVRAPEPAPEQPEPPRISFVQILASALAAVTSTIALSYFGVAGTIIGAAVASVVTVVGNVVYTRSILRAQRLALRPTARKGGTTPVETTPVEPDGTTSVELVETSSVVSTSSTDGGGSTRVSTSSTDEPSSTDETAEHVADTLTPRRWSRKRLVVASLALFAVVLAGITAIELFLGKPISDALNDEDGSGSSISQVFSGSSGSTDDPTTDDRGTSGSGTGGGTTTDDGGTADDTGGSATTEDESDAGTEETDPDTSEPEVDPDTDGTTDGTTDGGTDGSTDGTTDGETGTDSGTTDPTEPDGSTEPDGDASTTTPDSETESSTPAPATAVDTVTHTQAS
ncbi:hypothetical protein SAMN04489860_0337 [Paraoerskovia marina]|uniref:Uncharacterized protein n=1 Tax=Paraoerskovia marina TaxID=545619 RepID=A0A1H1MU90_9CELL|nr:hypothetical protein [Paraoerskovia marina]SDR90208.1 hypothetical protein SAMN04489860_0337 [Paraoerskovia marina]